jgi:hypothetical protein
MDNNQLPLPPMTVGQPISLREITELLIKHYDLHEGNYDLLLEFQMGVGMASQNLEQPPSPTAMIGISRLGLIQAPVNSPSTADASIVNPAKKPSKKK